MLLQIQKPGLQWAASENDWLTRFNRSVKDGSRPLLILWPFAPVAFVYDVTDTEGTPLPDDVMYPFLAHGPITPEVFDGFLRRLAKKGIEVIQIDFGSGLAGEIHSLEVGRASAARNEKPAYGIRLNSNHDANAKFATLTHELAHLYLGHLGPDLYLRIPTRARPSKLHRELEAESASYIVCKRSGVESSSAKYLSGYLDSHPMIDDVDVHAVLRAAGQIEALLDLACHTSFGDIPINYPLF